MATGTDLLRDTWLQGKTYRETAGYKANVLRDTWLQGQTY